MSGFEVSVERRDGFAVFGVGGRTNDRSFGRDVDALAKAYRAAVGDADPVPFYVASHGYDPATGEAALLVGGEQPREGLERLDLPAGLYARVEVAPRAVFLWGAAVGKTKRRFYARWLPESGYVARDLECEVHTEKSLGKRPKVDLLFAIEEETK